MQHLEVVNNTNDGFGIAVFVLVFLLFAIMARIFNLTDPTLADATIQGRTKLTLTVDLDVDIA